MILMLRLHNQQNSVSMVTGKQDESALGASVKRFLLWFTGIAAVWETLISTKVFP